MSTQRLLDVEIADELSDPVTGLLTASSQLQHLDYALLRARRSGGFVGVLVVDIDDFSDLIKQRGWSVSDAVLAQVGHRIEESMREDDVTARLFGDRFATICEGLDHPDQCEALERRVSEGFTTPIEVDGEPIPLILSIGAAIGDGHAKPERLIAEAERSMRSARDASVPSPGAGDRPRPVWAASALPSWVTEGL